MGFGNNAHLPTITPIPQPAYSGQWPGRDRPRGFQQVLLKCLTGSGRLPRTSPSEASRTTYPRKRGGSTPPQPPPPATNPAQAAAWGSMLGPTHCWLWPMTAFRHNTGSSLGASLGRLGPVQTTDSRSRWPSQPSLFRSQTVLCLYPQGRNTLCSRLLHLPPFGKGLDS